MADRTQNSNSHIVEIPVISEEKNQLLTLSTTFQHHPLSEISQSPGHFLLLKLLQRQEDLLTRLTSHKESRKDSIQLQIFHLCCFFFVFHGLFFSILFTKKRESESNSCSRWWIPLVLCACTSFLFVSLVHAKLCRYWKVYEGLLRDRNDARAVTRTVQELRMKGKSFDLCKEPLQSGKRLKSSSVEIKWRPLTWCSRYRVSVFLICFTSLALPCCRFVLCA